jgi:peptide/nickel transport system permease protein
MVRLALRSFATLLLYAIVGSIAIFVALRVIGGDAAAVILGRSSTPASLAALRHDLGLDRPWPVQYGDWLSGLVRGDLGVSYATRYNIASEIKQRLLVTVPLVLMTLTAASFLALVFGTLAARHARKARGTVIDVVSQIGICVPVFWLGLLLVGLVAVRWGVLPAGGFVPWGTDPLESLRSLLLPAITMTVPLSAVLTRYVRSSMLDVLSEDYIRTARARGRTLNSAMLVHGLRNAAIPVVTILGLELGGLLSGAVVVEVIFGLPGLGQLMLNAVVEREVVVVQSLGLVLLLVVLVVNFCTDLIYGLLDPRLRARGRGLLAAPATRVST